MDTKIQLQHPKGKRAIRMEIEKYEPIKNALLKVLSIRSSTQKELLEAVSDLFHATNVKFEGVLAWHLEWVKLDLEAKKSIIRLGNKSPIKYSLNKL